MSPDSAFAVAALAFAVVFTSLGLLALLLFTLRAAYQGLQGRAAAAPAETVDPELLAVLAAAAHAVLGAPVKIHRVHVHRGRGDEAWARVGRMDVMVSHRVVHKR